MTEPRRYPPMVRQALDEAVLVEKVHWKLIRRLDHFAAVAGVSPEALCTHLVEYVGEDGPERDWVREVLQNRRNPPRGLVYVGAWDDALNRMVGVAAALVRHFINARVLTTEELVEDAPDCTVLLIPNFEPARPKSMPDWKAGKLADLVLSRAASGKPTVLQVGSLGSLETNYGRHLAEVVKNSFTRMVQR